MCVSGSNLWFLFTVPATILADQSNVTVVEGQSVSLTCRASGDPPPSITWYEVTVLQSLHVSS